MEISSPPSVLNKETTLDDLPEDVILCIIPKLKLRDVLNFSFVSKQWKNIPACLERIELDIGMCKDGIQPCPEGMGAFVKGVNQFLKYYLKLRSMEALPVSLRTFSICLCLDKQSSADTDAWICMAVNNGVSTLFVILECSLHLVTGSIRPHEQKYIFPWHMLLKPSTALKRLVIRCCVFSCSLTSIWTSLEILELCDTVLTQYDVDKILHCFPNLQQIIFKYCKVPAKLTFGGGSLSCLSVMYCFDVEEIEVLDARLLREFCFKGFDVGLNLVNSYQLTNLTFGIIDVEGLRGIFRNLCQRFPAMRSLSIFSDCKTHPMLCHLYRQRSSLVHIKELKLYDHPDCGFNLQILGEVLKACPVLKRLEMVPPCTIDARNYNEFPVLQPHRCLEFINISGFCGSPGNVELAKFLVQVSEVPIHIVIKQKIEVMGYMHHGHSTSWHGEQTLEVIIETLRSLMKGGKLTFIRVKYI